MAPRLPWSRLVPGLVTIVVLVAVTVALLMYSSVGRIPGDTVRLFVVTNSAQGVMRGTEVWLAGQKVGVVEDVGFRPVSSDTSARVIIAIDVRARDLEQIRQDSDIRVRAGANLIGPIVVYISAGSPRSSPARNGDTLVATRQSDVQTAMSRLGDATKELAPIRNDARAVMATARSRNGTIGALRQAGIGAEMAELRSRVNALRGRFGASAEPRAQVMASARNVLSRVDSIHLLLRSGQNSLGRFRRDSTLRQSLASARDEIAELRARMQDNRGTLGRFAADSAIQRSLTSAQAELTLLLEDMRKRPLRYIAF